MIKYHFRLFIFVRLQIFSMDDFSISVSSRVGSDLFVFSSHYSSRSQGALRMLVPRANTGLGKKKQNKKTFRYAAPWSWNDLEKDLRLPEQISSGEFQSVLTDRETNSIGHCTCFQMVWLLNHLKWFWSVECCCCNVVLNYSALTPVVLLLFYVPCNFVWLPSWPGLEKEILISISLSYLVK